MSDRKWKSLVCIDDSGTPGMEAPTKHLHKDRKTWVAIFFGENDIIFLNEGYLNILNVVKKRFGSEELHFTDIYSGKREWKKVSLEDRLFIFETFAEIFANLRFELIVQTFSPDNLKELPQLKEINSGLFDFTKPEDAALALLLARINIFCKDHPDDYKPLSRIVVDHGWKKAGHTMPVPRLKLAGGQIEFHNSKSFPPLQFADFAAFSLNRSQWVAAKEKKNELDIFMLRLFAKANFNYINITTMKIDPHQSTTKDYESVLEEDRLAKGLKPRPWEE